jgi:hypothetical protein
MPTTAQMLRELARRGLAVPCAVCEGTGRAGRLDRIWGWLIGEPAWGRCRRCSGYGLVTRRHG